MTDFVSLLRVLTDAEVEFILVGGAAAIAELERLRDADGQQNGPEA